MVLARPEFLSSSSTKAPSFVDDGRESSVAYGMERSDMGRDGTRGIDEIKTVELDPEAARPPYIHAMLAGGLGGTTGDMLMHSLDTVKTRQQGDPHMPPKYTSMGKSYYTIWRQEGIRRGLYGGVTPAFIGSFTGTVCFFGSYEYTKRKMLDRGINPSFTYLTAGFIADLVASPLYVPSEVLKTRLQLQGRYNNPHFDSGYNYRSTYHAARTIVRTESFAALFYGYKATLWRDIPFSGLQFAFYEQEQKLAKAWVGMAPDGRQASIGLPLEIITGATAGGMAGVLTCPLDVVKTRIQTQLHPTATPVKSQKPHSSKPSLPKNKPLSPPTLSSDLRNTPPTPSSRSISTSSPSTTLRVHHAVTLDTSSVVTGLRMIYRSEGIWGWFRGVGPRMVWTSTQSGTMLVLYQTLLRFFEAHPLVNDNRDEEGLYG